MNAKTLEAVKRHGESLLLAFPNCTEKDPVALCKKLRRIEVATHYVMTQYCNGDLTADKADAAEEHAITRIRKLLNCADHPAYVGLFVNRDPRGYALKLSSEWTQDYNRREYAHGKSGLPIYTDWGGYGILAPDLTA